jgi:hypothetical protein
MHQAITAERELGGLANGCSMARFDGWFLQHTIGTLPGWGGEGRIGGLPGMPGAAV